MNTGEPRTWRYRTWGARTASVVASSVEFTAHHVVWRDSDGSVVLAEANTNVHRLSEVGHLGSATNHIEEATS